MLYCAILIVCLKEKKDYYFIIGKNKDNIIQKKIIDVFQVLCGMIVKEAMAY